jgi:rhodanese-related sulfurtransferase
MSQPTGGPRTAAQMVAEARTRIESLHPEQVAHEVEHGALLVDLRESEERAQNGIIAGSIHAPRGMLEFWADPSSAYHRAEFDPSRRIILHCASGGRSALAADLLKEMGYENVAHLEGGLKAWKESGRSSEPHDAPRPASPQA